MIERQLCVVCNLRAGTFFKKKACRRCAARTGAEGTREKYGLPKPRDAARRQAAFIRTWNRMRLEGATVAQIAKQMELPEQTVKNTAGKLRAQGFQLELSQVTLLHRRVQAQDPVDRAALARKSNEHGGGKCGIAKCQCEPCLERRRQYRKEWHQANRDKVQRYQTAYRNSKRDKPS